MPNHKSAEKRDRQNARRNAMNTAHRSRLRSTIKKLRTAVAAGSKDWFISLKLGDLKIESYHAEQDS